MGTFNIEEWLATGPPLSERNKRESMSTFDIEEWLVALSPDSTTAPFGSGSGKDVSSLELRPQWLREFLITPFELIAFGLRCWACPGLSSMFR